MTTAQAILPTAELPTRAHRLRDQFQSAEPFPHAVVDGLFNHGALQEAAEGGDPDAILAVSGALASDEFVTYLSILTGISGLEADPAGVRMFSTKQGEQLGTGAAGHRNGAGERHRRVSAYLFAGSPWRDGWGGHLELWDGRERCAKRVAPAINTLAVLAISPRSWHGHAPSTCPEHAARIYFAAHFHAPHPAQAGP